MFNYIIFSAVDKKNLLKEFREFWYLLVYVHFVWYWFYIPDCFNFTVVINNLILIHRLFGFSDSICQNVTILFVVIFQISVIAVPTK